VAGCYEDSNDLWVTYNPGSFQKNAAGIVNIQHGLNIVKNTKSNQTTFHLPNYITTHHLLLKSQKPTVMVSANQMQEAITMLELYN